MDSLINETTTMVAVVISGSGSKMQFREDGLRQPPDYTASNNLIIMVMGLSILIVPVVCFVICMCMRTGVFKSIKNLKLTNAHGDGSKLPYSQFDSEYSQSSMKIPVSKDVKVLIRSDNAAAGSPKFNKNNGESVCNIMKKSTALKPSTSSTSLEFSTVDLDPTFVQDNSSYNQHHNPHS